MRDNRYAVIDIGTNTFHLLIVDIVDDHFRLVRKEREAVRLGLGGIEKQIIAPEAQKRAFNALAYFNDIARKNEVSEFFVYATSAVRNAKNKTDFITQVYEKTGLSINVIDGEREADLIYKGVKLEKGILTKEPSLIVDIGGGSIEFIIANDTERLWAKSFEIGGQRLRNMFHVNDPISKEELKGLYEYLKKSLQPLVTAINKYRPISMVGCSGTFDTLLEIEQHRTELENNSFSKRFFNMIHKELVSKDRSDRLSIQGMIVLRVDLIVVSACVVDYLLDIMRIDSCRVSRNALKEGVVLEILENSTAQASI